MNFDYIKKISQPKTKTKTSMYNIKGEIQKDNRIDIHTCKHIHWISFQDYTLESTSVCLCGGKRAENEGQGWEESLHFLYVLRLLNICTFYLSYKYI